jgi:adenylate cyclase
MDGRQATPPLEESMPEESMLERILLGGPPVYSQAEISAKSGLPEELGVRIWTALGFPTPAEDETAFTERDLEALRDIRDLLGDELVDEELVLHLSRAVGQTMGRLSSWLVDVWTKRAAEYLSTDDPQVVAAAVQSGRELLPKFERLLLQGWRHQLAASGMRALTTVAAASADPAAGTATLVVGFCDIVSFTRLSREMDGDTLASFVEGFEEAASALCAELGCRIVKTLGDEVLFTAVDPTAAAEFALRMTERSAVEKGFPRVRVGMARGEIIQRLGDVFGTPVNLAARLTSVANPGTALVDGVLARELAGYEIQPLRPRPVQGFGRVRPRVLRRAAPRDHRREPQNDG